MIIYYWLCNLMDQIFYNQSLARDMDYVRLSLLIFVMEAWYVVCELETEILEGIYKNFLLQRYEPVRSIGNANHRIESRKAAVWTPGVGAVTCRPPRPARSSVSLQLTCDGRATADSHRQVLLAGDITASRLHTLHSCMLQCLLHFSVPNNSIQFNSIQF